MTDFADLKRKTYKKKRKTFSAAQNPNETGAADEGKYDLVLKYYKISLFTSYSSCFIFILHHAPIVAMVTRAYSSISKWTTYVEFRLTCHKNTTTTIIT